MTTRPFIKPRALDQQVSFEGLDVTRGSRGGLIRGWSPLFGGAKFWARVEDKTGKLAQVSSAGGGEAPTSVYVVELRYRSGIEAGTVRVVHESKVYTITHVDDRYRQQDKLILQCELGVRGHG